MALSRLARQTHSPYETLHQRIVKETTELFHRLRIKTIEVWMENVFVVQKHILRALALKHLAAARAATHASSFVNDCLKVRSFLFLIGGGSHVDCFSVGKLVSHEIKKPHGPF
jgi:hypothetical protein